MTDFRNRYVIEGKFDICGLINDDFVLAIKETWNKKRYTSCLKLLVSFIDTMAFVQNGDSSSTFFKHWVSSYVDLSPIGITPDELWEHRNALLHMSTYDSRKVLSGCVSRLVPYVGSSNPPESKANVKYYSMYSLIMAVMQGLGKYVLVMEKDDVMRQRFCDNYEKTISDSHFFIP
jgi:hypothetical protein